MCIMFVITVISPVGICLYLLYISVIITCTVAFSSSKSTFSEF